MTAMTYDEAFDFSQLTGPAAAPAAAPQPATDTGVEPMTRRRVLSLATPIIGENLLQTAVGAVDTFLVARLGAAAVAGVGTGFEIVFFIISILSAIDIGATVLVSQAIGAGERQRANHLARQAIVWGLILAVPVSIGMYFATPSIIGVFGTEPEVAAAATTYLQIIAATSAALLLSFVCGAVLRGAGDSRTPLVAAVIANIVNVVVSYVLITGHLGLPEMGVAGSAIGAAVARAVSAAFMLTVMATGRKAVSLNGTWGWRPRLDIARQIFTLGLPAAVEQVLSSGAFMTLIGVVAVIGTPALAAQQIAFTALSIAFLPGIAFSIAATALVGQSIGARRPADARQAWSIGMTWAVAWLGIGGVATFFLAERMMGIYTSDPAVIDAGVSALRALSLSLPFWAVSFVSSGSLRGSGDTRTPLIIGAATMWVSVILAWIGVNGFGGDLGWVWTGFALTTTPAALLMVRMFRRRIGAFESGAREMPDVAGAMAH